MKKLAQHLSKSAEWYTPPEYSAAARYLMGAIDLDPATCLLANADVQAERWYTKADNGLAQEWHGRVFLNPPGSSDGELPRLFWEKLVRAHESGAVPQAVFLGFSLEQLLSLQKKKKKKLRGAAPRWTSRSASPGVGSRSSRPTASPSPAPRTATS